MNNKYEEICKRGKALNTASVGYGKIVLSFWCIVIGLVVIWFKWKIGLSFIVIGFAFFIWATLQKRNRSKILMNKIIKQYTDKK